MDTELREQLQRALGAAYHIERELGRGGMAIVYLATDIKHHRSVALKVLQSDLAVALGPERFHREIAIVATLQHPHIVPVLDSGTTPDGQLWFTMPFIDGESLRDRLTRETQLPVDDAVRITREIADALDYAHQQGIVHRDVKPENILLSRGHALLADFGVARTMPETGEKARSLTQTGLVLGTPAYASPEQATGERTVDRRTDVYALGCVLYELLTGEPPYTGPTAQAILAKRVTGDIPSVRRTRPAVPAHIEAAVTKSLALVPADRYATAAEFARALDAPSGATTVARPGALRRLRARAGPLAVAACLAAGLLALWRYRESAAGANASPGPIGVAVLPFDTEGDTANAYFADGIAGEIQGRLSALPALRVIASSSANEYRRSSKPPNQIGHELGVRYLLLGRIQWEHGAGGARRVRVSPELVEVGEGTAPATKWRQSYDTTLADVFDVQTAVATQVVQRLGVVLTGDAQTMLAARPTRNIAAYDAYLRARAVDASDLASTRRALAAAERAVALDSTFADAWALVSLDYMWLYSTSDRSPPNAEAARRAAARAVAVGPASAEAYLARGGYADLVTHDIAAARADLETALRLDPSSSRAFRALVSLDLSAGRITSAVAHARQAAALDPRSPNASAILAQVLQDAGEESAARAEAERGLVFAPTDMELIKTDASTFTDQGDLAGARAALRDVSPNLDRAALVAYMSESVDCSWMLDSADRALLLTLPPAAFDNNRAAWGLARARVFWRASDTVSTRRYADSARIPIEAQLHQAPNDLALHLMHGLTLAYLGQTAAAVRAGERGVALALAENDDVGDGYARFELAEVYVAIGDHVRAVEQLDSVLSRPHGLTTGALRVDPTWAPLRGDSRFEQLLARRPAKPTI